MLEIIALIFLCRKIGETAIRKGLKPGQWKFITVITWFGFEFLGGVIAYLLFGYNQDNLIGLGAFALACAFGGYLLVKAILNKKPDSIDNEIDQIGSSGS